ncbi:MAG TPA: transglutaminase family protein [Steroidobacteraceae bacterium]
MKIRFGYELLYGSTQVTPLVLCLRAAPSPSQRLLVSDVVRTDPFVPVVSSRDAFGNLCTRLIAPAGTVRISTAGLLDDPGTAEPAFRDARETPIANLPADTLMYVLPSRYCESDLLAPEALRLFGYLRRGWSRVQAICDFVHQYVACGGSPDRQAQTALETYNAGQGLYQDMTHLAIAFCRALGIPARYATGYLDGFGVPAVDAPVDFPSCVEAFLDGAWHIFEPRNNVRRIGRLIIARGRDAADVAIGSAFGAATLQQFRLWTDQISDTDAIQAA